MTPIKTAPKNNLQDKKAPMSLLPMDLFRKYLLPAYEEGLIKYEKESWRDGFYTSTMIDAALRHIELFYWQGEDFDKESVTGKHHLSGAIFSLFSILQTLEQKPEKSYSKRNKTKSNKPKRDTRGG